MRTQQQQNVFAHDSRNVFLQETVDCTEKSRSVTVSAQNDAPLPSYMLITYITYPFNTG